MLNKIPPQYRRVFKTAFIADHKYPLLLVTIAILTHVLWFKPGTVLFHADWLHWSDNAARQAVHALGSWNTYNDLGSPRVQIGFSVVEDLWSLIAIVGGSFDTAVKLTLMLPVAILSFLAPYLAMRKIVGDKFVSFTTALFYGSTTYILLRERTQLQIALIYACAPLFFILFKKAWETLKTKDVVVFSLAYSVGLCVEVRIMYIVTFLLAVYAFLTIDTSKLRQLIKPSIVAVVTILGLSCFWIIPTIFGGAGAVVQEKTSRGLFGNHLFDLFHAITLSSAGWNGGAPLENFVMQPIRPYLWFVPFVIFIVLIASSKMKIGNRKLVTYFMIVALVGIFLTKQALDPLPGAYAWLYGHLPGFSLFREASKFYLLTAFGYMGLLGIGLMYFKRGSRKSFYFAAGGILLVSAVNLRPMITGEIGGLSTNRTVPEDYKLVNKQITSSKSFARTLWVPIDSQWAQYDVTNPKVNSINLLTSWESLLSDSQGGSEHQRLLEMFNKPYAANLVKVSSVRYVVVPLRDIANENDFFPAYGNNRQDYIDTLDKISWLKRIDIGTREVVIYENKNYQQYITATTNLLALSSLDNLQSIYNFNNKALGSDFNFALDDKQQLGQAIFTRDIFGDVKAANAKPGVLGATIKSATDKPVLYMNTNKPSISLSVNNGMAELVATRRIGLRVNGQPLGNEQTEAQVLGSVKNDSNRQYYLQVGSELTPVRLSGKSLRQFGPANGDVRIFSSDKTNLVPNYSFEKGLWQKQVGDCDNYDRFPNIKMDITEYEYTQGDKSLEMKSVRHNACASSAPISVTPGSEYILNFDYMAKNANELQYQITFDDSKHSSIKESKLISDIRWHTARKAFVVPVGATNATIKLISIPGSDRDQLTNPSTTYFDNVKLYGARAEINSSLDLAPRYTKIDLSSKNNTFDYTDSSFQGQNLVPNPSFEAGLWQSKVGDCNKYDDNPALKMSLATDASNGRKSLELAAKRHSACTSTPRIKVNENAAYMVSFDSQSLNTKTVSYSIRFDDDDRTSINGTTPASKHWQDFTRVIRVPTGAHNLTINLYVAGPVGGRNFTVNRFDNFKLIAVPDIQDQYYLVDAPAEMLTVPKEVTYTQNSPTKKQVQIREAKSPFYLTMSEAYNPQWQLELDNNSARGVLASWIPSAKPNIVARSNHIKWDDFMNGWYVDPATICKNMYSGCQRNKDGTYNLNMIIEFAPQRWFYVGEIVGGISLVGCIVFLVLSREKTEKVWKLRR